MELSRQTSSLLTRSICAVNGRLQIDGGRSILKDERCAAMLDLIDRMGAASAKAQGLNAPVTTGDKLINSDHTLYVMKEESEERNEKMKSRDDSHDRDSSTAKVVAILKMGHKKLFLLNETGKHDEFFPLCVLDFYVHESRQRIGLGKKLFEFMLKEENVIPNALAIDRPSIKFLSFLAKHYNLRNTIPQTNNFIVYEGFFIHNSVCRRKSLDLQQTYADRQLSTLINPTYKKQNRSSYPYYTDNSNSFTWTDDPGDKFNAQTTNVCGKNQRTFASDRTEKSDNEFAAAAAAAAATPKTHSNTATPDQSPGSQANSVAEDSAMKIFGVPSAWMQTANH